MVAEEQVWEALAEIPDPEIPVISLVELGVIRGVEIEDGRVRVDFTPTFLGCPAIEVMQTAMAERIRVQLQSQAFSCPYCGSSDTALENIFGPTPCRSLRYCRSCRQPFEQFKTI